MEKKILVIDDNETMREGICESLKREGYSVFPFGSGLEAVEAFKENSASLAIVDLKMEPIDGLETLRRLKEINPELESIMISAYGTVNSAVEAMKLGASDFLTKPFSPDEIRIRVKKIFEKLESEEKINELVEQNKLLNDEINSGYEEIIGESEAIRNIFSFLNGITETESTILIQGESGTGKELIARAIYKKSRRADKPFIKINCGALNDNLLESELFGHEKGSFTGAVRQKKGRFELANNGTIFLDEIGDISQTMQVKLLRVLQEGEFERVGGEETKKVNVRVISASNKDLQKLITAGKFREDLYYRLSVVPIRIPSLRERKEDIKLLSVYFLNKLSAKYNSPPKNIGDDGVELLEEYSWPGNIRELENLMERLFVISQENKINTMLIAQHLSRGFSTHENYDNLHLADALFNFEKKLIIQAMNKSNGVKNRAAKLLGIKTSALYYKLEKFGLI